MKSLEIARMFDQMANVLEFQGELFFKVNAYRKASRSLRELDRDLTAIWQAGELEQIPGIGVGLAKKIDEYLRTGRMSKYDEVLSLLPASLRELLNIPGLTPKILALAHRQLGVTTLTDLKAVIENGKLTALSGVGEQKTQDILAGIRLFEQL